MRRRIRIKRRIRRKIRITYKLLFNRKSIKMMQNKYTIR